MKRSVWCRLAGTTLLLLLLSSCSKKQPKAATEGSSGDGTSRHEQACVLATKILADTSRPLEARMEQLVAAADDAGMRREMGELIDAAEGDSGASADLKCDALARAVAMRRAGEDDVAPARDAARELERICDEATRIAGAGGSFLDLGRAIQGTLTTPEAKNTWNALENSAPQQRAPMFSAAAKEAGVADRDCPALAKLAAAR